jgi:hypothetical protein
VLGARISGEIQFCGSILRSSLDVFTEKAKADVDSAAYASEVVDDDNDENDDDGDASFCLSLAAYLAERS